MSSVTTIPETGVMSRDELSADDAWRVVRTYGVRRLNVTGIALLGGIAVAAQLEAVRAGRPDPKRADVDGVADRADVAVPGMVAR